MQELILSLGTDRTMWLSLKSFSTSYIIKHNRFKVFRRWREATSKNTKLEAQLLVCVFSCFSDLDAFFTFRMICTSFSI